MILSYVYNKDMCSGLVPTSPIFELSVHENDISCGKIYTKYERFGHNQKCTSNRAGDV